MPNPDLFVYHAPNPETAPRYEAITDAWVKCHHAVSHVLVIALNSTRVPESSDYESINAECKAFFDVVQKVCPPSADRSAAERCIRLARMKANEAMRPTLSGAGPLWKQDVANLALGELLNAKLQANASIALALPNELPAWEG